MTLVLCRRKASSILPLSQIRPRYAHQDHYRPFAPLSPRRPSSEQEEFVVYNPANGDLLCTVESASVDEVQDAVHHAHETFRSGIWSKASPIARSVVLSRLARALEERTADFARIESLQTGRTIREMNAQLGRLPEWLHYYASLLRTHQAYVAPTQGKLLNYVQRIPLGVVAQITPFNHPLFIAVKKIAPALAAGNSVIVKPSELAPISLLEFAQIATDAGIPQGVLTILPGLGPTTGKALVSNPLVRKVDLTAGTSTGRALGAIVGSNLAAFTAELGGKAPIVIFDDADLKSAVNGATFSALIASGQTCVSGTRLIIQENIYDRFMTAIAEKFKSVTRRMGDPANPQSSMGSVISPRHLERIINMVNSRNGGNILVGGGRMLGKSTLDGFDFSRGSFFAPTIIADVDIRYELWQEEIFGPVVVVKKFTDEAEGVALANASKYGLGAGIWTTDLSRAHRVAADIESGIVWVNSHHRNDPSSPWGGMKESGIGRENGVEAFESYSQSKSVIVNIATSEESRRDDDWFAESGEAKRYG
ncbi:aldehyde dehydrogenase domain-containing protein [Hygrophoropsis aurantiaca]|uniref:Aldehyde dehydrogenase domain-containing protein n=1 Tax=Hygrophoropsis aurantiaca TaxID=72124 RepID=A0ACB8AG79_9AGAM|nr:aldehyde dehydrogenase domain-containing protein [Hygrophoropsis aurantiaca]